MSQDEVIIDEQALAAVSNTIETYIKNYRENFESGIRKLKVNSEDWNDEDFNSLLSAISFFKADIDTIDLEITRLKTRINAKIEAIHALHNMKI